MRRTFPIRLFAGTLVASTTSVESGVVRFDSAFPRTIVIVPTSASAVADVKLEYAVSQDGVTFGDYTDNTALIQSSLSSGGATPEDPRAVDVVADIQQALFVKFRVTGVNTNPADTLVTCDLICEEST